jgi:hypothetical protein
LTSPLLSVKPLYLFVAIDAPYNYLVEQSALCIFFLIAH